MTVFRTTLHGEPVTAEVLKAPGELVAAVARFPDPCPGGCWYVGAGQDLANPSHARCSRCGTTASAHT